MDRDGNLISRKVMYGSGSLLILRHSSYEEEDVGFDQSHPHFSSLFKMGLGQVIRKVIRRVATPTPDNQGSDAQYRFSPSLPADGSEVGTVRPFDYILGERWST